MTPTARDPITRAHLVDAGKAAAVALAGVASWAICVYLLAGCRGLDPGAP